MRRAAISPFFSKINVNAAESMIYDKMEELDQQLKQQLEHNGVAEMRKNFLAMTTDTLCAHTFDKSLDLLKCDEEAVNWQKTIRAVATLTPLQKQFTWIIPAALMLPLTFLRLIVPDLARIVALHRVPCLFSYHMDMMCKSLTISVHRICTSKRRKSFKRPP